jgi:polyisoprenoid-binding protein YceI
MSTLITETFAIDPSHSGVEFSVRHLAISKVRGRFSAVAGTIEIPAGSDVPSALSAEIEVDSIDTRDAQRDGHLKSEDFFHAGEYPKLRFTSTRIESAGGNRLTIAGDLEIRGVTKPVTIDGAFEGRAKDPWGNERVALSGTTSINRKDFGLVWNQPLETGGLLVGEKIEITLEVEAIAKK